MTEPNEEQYGMDDLNKLFNYWGLGDPPDQVKDHMLKMLNTVSSQESLALGQEFTRDAVNILQSSHEDADLYRRSLQVPGFIAAASNHQYNFLNFIDEALKNIGMSLPSDSEDMPPREFSEIIVIGVEIATVLGFMAGQAVKREAALDKLWGSSIVTKEQVENAEAQRESNEGLEGLSFEEIDSSQLGGECIECGFNYENEAEFTKHVLGKHN